MKQITKVTVVLALIISLASCQSSKSGCYDFGAVKEKVSDKKDSNSQSKLIFTNVMCKP